MKRQVRTQSGFMGRMRQMGQGMTEYIIIVALIAIAAIAVYQLFGKTVRGQVGGMAQELAGSDGTASQQNAAGAAGGAEAQGGADKGLDSYTGNRADGAN